MAITQIIATLPAVLNDSETFYEDIAIRNNSLVTVSFPSINTWSTQANALAVEVNDKAAQVASQAVDGGYSQDYINTNFVGVNNAQTIAGIKTFSSSPIVPTPTTDYQVANKKYIDDNIPPEYNPTPIIATGTATFTASTNNINLTGIGVGVEIGDVIQISGAEDAKNNSEFTVEVITDDDNIIVNQAHANKGTTKNIANRESDSNVTIKLLAKWYNAKIGLGQDWVNVAPSRIIGTIYSNTTQREIIISVCAAGSDAGLVITVNSINIIGVDIDNTTSSNLLGTSANIQKNSNYSASLTGGVYAKWFELR